MITGLPFIKKIQLNRKRQRERERERERIQKVAFLRTHKVVKNMHEQYYDNL